MKILCFIDYYIPGFKAGGPIRTIVNMVNQLGDEFEFLIVTRDRDLLDCDAYQNILVNQWNCVGKSKVFYVSPKNFSFLKILQILRETNYDILYLNSFFSLKMTVLPLLINLLAFSKKSPIIIAPRGEFSVSALSSKSLQKSFYIYLFNQFTKNSSIAIQASSSSELEDIKCRLIVKNFFIASDFFSIENKHENFTNSKKKITSLRNLRILFLSRISPIKNLDYLLLVLKKIKFNIELSIYGPKEDIKYWSYCKKIIQTLPRNIRVKYNNEINHKLVSKVFQAHDLFVFPTKSENFGHVIFESLSAGTPVIISNNTPWLSDNGGAVEVISLKNPNDWVSAINRWKKFNNKTRANLHLSALAYSRDFLMNKQFEIQAQNRIMFSSVINKYKEQVSS